MQRRRPIFFYILNPQFFYMCCSRYGGLSNILQRTAFLIPALFWEISCNGYPSWYLQCFGKYPAKYILPDTCIILGNILQRMSFLIPAVFWETSCNVCPSWYLHCFGKYPAKYVLPNTSTVWGNILKGMSILILALFWEMSCNGFPFWYLHCFGKSRGSEWSFRTDRLSRNVSIELPFHIR